MPSLLPRLKQTIHDEVVKEMKEFAVEVGAKAFHISCRYGSIAGEGNN